jgi:translation initiation factor 1
MKKNNKDLTPQEKLSHNPFAALLKGNKEPSEGKAPLKPQDDEAGARAGGLRNTSRHDGPPELQSGVAKDHKMKRVVLRLERKGHGGKEMTRIEKLTLTSTLLEQWLKEIKQSLGCGGVIDGEDLLIQGDQRDRLSAFFTKKGIAAQS